MGSYKHTILSVFRLLVTLASLFAVAVLFHRNLASKNAVGALVHTLAYFTVQTNLFVCGWNIAALGRESRGKNSGKNAGFLRGAFVVFISVTCIVYALFLRPYWKPEGLMATADVILHFVVPLSFILDWIVTEKPGTLRPRWTFAWLIYPLVYLAGALFFARLTGIYVYPFIDLSKLGPGRFTLNALALALGFLILSWFYVGVDALKKHFVRYDSCKTVR